MIVFGKDNCPYCVKAKELLEELNIPYIYVDIGQKEVGLNRALKQNLMDYLDSINQPHTVPQIFGEEGHIGGYEALTWDLSHRGLL